MNLTFQKDEIIKEVYRRLSYISGKRASGADDYFRFSPCEADIPLFLRLADEAVALIVGRLGTLCSSSSISHNTFSFNIVCREVTVSGEDIGFHPVAISLFGSIVCRIVYLWLRISGFDSHPEWDAAAEAELSLLMSTLNARNRSPLKPRPVMP